MPSNCIKVNERSTNFMKGLLQGMADNIEICNYLKQQGIKNTNLGYRYLTSAIHIGLESPPLKIADLYRKVAEMHSTTALSVERAIRYSLIDKNITNKKFIYNAVEKFEADSIKKDNIKNITFKVASV